MVSAALGYCEHTSTSEIDAFNKHRALEVRLSGKRLGIAVAEMAGVARHDDGNCLAGPGSNQVSRESWVSSASISYTPLTIPQQQHALLGHLPTQAL